MIGAGAGFGAAIGAPIAGAIFGMEVVKIGNFRLMAVWEAFVASLFGYGVTLFLGAPHSVYPRFVMPPPNFEVLGAVVMLGILCGLMAFAFIRATHLLERAQTKLIPWTWARPIFGGAILALLFQIPENQKFSGLGIERIQGAFNNPSAWSEPLLKAAFTVLTIGTGFKGGEFIPLVYIGTTMGSALGLTLQVTFPLLAAVGFAALFGAASMAPVACSIMAAEIFGSEVFPYALLAGLIAYLVSGRRSIYASQKNERKYQWFRKFTRAPGKNET
jgi:H+/Cl- antiporter ClcA